MLPPPGRRWSFQLPPAHPKNPSQCLKLPIKGGGGGGQSPLTIITLKSLFFLLPELGSFQIHLTHMYLLID